MKGLLKKIAICAFALFCLVGFAACGGNKGPSLEKVEEERQTALQAFKDVYSKLNLDEIAESNSAEAVEEIKKLIAAGEEAIKNATNEDNQKAIDAIKEALAKAKSDLSDYTDKLILVALAEGTYSYVAASYEDRVKILGVLEKYAIDAGLTGITVYEDSGYVLYNPLVIKGTENYIPGYGFGILTEGRANGDLSGEQNAAWKRYYHTFEADDPKNINYGDDKGSVVGDIVGYVMDSYWGNKMNETKDGYEWINGLANEKPQPVNQSAVTGLATKYKFEVKIGSQAKYNTLTKNAELAKFKGREIKVEDYLTPFKLLFTKANGWARGTENLTGSSAIKGMNAYYNASADGFNAVAWEKVGLKAYEENGKGYVEVEFVQPCSKFYAMYYMASSIYAPIPQEFVDAIGGAKFYGKFDKEHGLTPVDTTLATGPYVLETWEEDKLITFKKNELYYDKTLYQGWEGVHVAILPATKEDAEAAYREFEAGKLTSCGIPSTKLQELKNDPRACKTVGSSTTKLNINTCTQEQWEKLFGKNGTITQTEPENYWQVEPALSNNNFIKGLSYAINRVEFAEALGRTASVNYFSSNYMGDPENGLAYNNSQAHKDAVAELLEGTDGYGYSLEKARAYFKKACEELLASGAYKEGDKIVLEMAWQAQRNVEQIQKPIEKYWTEAFNHESVCGNKLTLELKSFVPEQWSDVYYKKMMIGQYDIGFGGISGNPLNPLNFFEVLKSDNSSGFTLNWGVDTNKVSKDLIWEGQAWSFDALWQAAETGGYFKDGLLVPNYNPELVSSTKNEDGTATIEIKANLVKADGVSVKVADTVIFGYFDVEGKAAYAEDSVAFVYDEKTDIITVTVSAELYEKYSKALEDSNFGIDCYFEVVVLEIDSNTLQTVPLAGLPK